MGEKRNWDTTRKAYANQSFHGNQLQGGSIKRHLFFFFLFLVIHQKISKSSNVQENDTEQQFSGVLVDNRYQF